MKVILDSGVWWRVSLRLPMKKPLADFLKHDVTEWWLSPFAAAEMLYQVNHKKLVAPQDHNWLAEAMRGYRIAPFSLAAGIRAGNLDWEQGGPVGRLMAGNGGGGRLALVHSGLVLKNLTGFPQLYFPA